jgi:HlyD family secretion protein
MANQARLLELTRDQAVERAQSALAANRQALDAARARRRMVTEPARPEILAQQRAELAAANQNLTNVQASGQAGIQQLRNTPVRANLAQARGQLAAAQRAAQAARAQLVTRDIVSPFAGTVTEILSYPGDVVGPGQGVVRLSQTGQMQVKVDVDERDIALVSPGRRAVLIADAYPNRSIPARVIEVGAYTDPQRGTIQVTIQPAIPVPLLRDGATVDATIIIEEAQQHLLVPLTSVIRTGDQAVVMVVVNGRVRQRPVGLGTGSAQGVVVLSGLSKSDRVVLDPLSVQPSERVRAREE